MAIIKQTAMTPKEQAINFIQKSSSVGIALPEKAGVDESASYLALSRILTKLGKGVGVIFSGEIPKTLREVLPAEAFDNINEGLPHEFVIAVNHSASQLKELRYEREGDSLNIILTPKDRPIKKEDISFRQGQAKYDLILTLGAHALEDLGRAFEESPNLFYETPLIAVDASMEHEAFAEVNLTDAGRSSVSEITADLALALSEESVDALASTALLAGIITKTKNLQNNRTKPATLAISAELVARGAKKDEIVRVLWKTKPLPLLQVWGRASVRSRLDNEKGILWSVLTKDDFAKTQTLPEEAIPFVLDHIEEHFALPEAFVLLWQRIEDGMIQALVRTAAAAPLGEELVLFGPRGNCRVFKTPFPTFVEAETAVLALLSNQIRV